MENIIKKIQKRTLKMPFGEWTWGEGVALWGLNYSNKAIPMHGYNDFLKEWVDKNISENKINFTINGSIPCIAAGEVYKNCDDEKYKEVVINQADFLINEAPRLSNGAFEHTDKLIAFSKQMWADTLFMAGLFLAYTYNMTGDKKYLDEAVNQFVVHTKMLQKENGLFYHGYDEATDKNIGLAWGRANAWVSVGIVEMLDFISDSDIRQKLVEGLKKQLDAVKKYQHDNGMFRTIIDGEFSYEETSCAYGFGYAVLKGMRTGILDSEYKVIVDKMAESLVENVADDGMITGVSAGTPVMRIEGEYDIICNHRIQTWGQGLALMYFSELLQSDLIN